MPIAQIIEALAQGAQHGYNRKTLGPDYAERLAEALARRKQENLAAQVTQAQLRAAGRAEGEAELKSAAELEEAQGATYPVAPGEDPSNVVVTPQDPKALIAKYRAMRSAEEHGLNTRKSEADIAAQEALATERNAKPDFREQDLDIKRQRLEADIKSAEARLAMAGSAQALNAARLDLQRLKFELHDMPREDRLASTIPPGIQTALSGILDSHYQVRTVRAQVKDPEVQQILGPFMGRAAQGLAQYAGGANLTPKQQEGIVAITTLFGQEAFSEGGKNLTGHEKELFQKTRILPTDTVSMGLSKLAVRERILDQSAKRRYSLLRPAQQQQASEAFAQEGFDFQPASGGQGDANTAVPLDGPPTHGSPAGDGPKVQTWNPATKRFE